LRTDARLTNPEKRAELFTKPLVADINDRSLVDSEREWDVSEILEVGTVDGVRTLTLDRPQARNALNRDLLGELVSALQAAEADDEVSVLVLTGRDPAFCAGLDLAEFADPSIDLLSVVHTPATDPFAALKSLSKPVIAAVNGPAMTGGLELALNCDFIIASERARFADSHAKVGAIPGGGSTGLLPQAVGLRLAKELTLTGRPMGANEALSAGLVNHVVPHEDLLSQASQLADAIAGADQRAARKLKQLYDQGALVTLAECHRLEEEAYVAWEVSAEEIGRRREGILAAGKQSTPS
jgi:enoyl-CoA hydratase/carnithine racemase